MNTVFLIGRLTKDPELRYVPSTGKGVGNFSIAVDRDYTKNGEKQTDFFNVVTFGKTAENCANYLAKGRLVAVKGSVEINSYEDKNGQRRQYTQIVAERVQFLEWGDKKQSSKSSYADEPGYKELDYKELDDVPF